MMRATEPEERKKNCQDGTTGTAMFTSCTCRECGVVKWKEAMAGPTNSCGHLAACHGSVEVVKELHHQAWQQMLFGQANTTDSFLKLTKATPDQEAAHDWINATVEKSWPMLHVGDTTVRHFSKHAEIPLSSEHSKAVMHHLVE